MLLTYRLPLIPFVLGFDGVVSCLRAYSQEELAEMTAGLGEGRYDWDLGEDRTGRMGVTYLIGWPQKAESDQVEDVPTGVVVNA